jgi:hypothetical protein
MIHIRRATGADIVDISRLCGRLGYSADARTVRERFVVIEIDPRHAPAGYSVEGGAVLFTCYHQTQVGSPPVAPLGANTLSL